MPSNSSLEALLDRLWLFYYLEDLEASCLLLDGLFLIYQRMWDIKTYLHFNGQKDLYGRKYCKSNLTFFMSRTWRDIFISRSHTLFSCRKSPIIKSLVMAFIVSVFSWRPLFSFKIVFSLPCTYFIEDTYSLS